MKKLTILVTSLLSSLAVVSAQGTNSSLLPPAIQDIFDLFGPGGVGVAAFITSRAQSLIYIVLGLIILIAVGYSVMAGIKYIRSEGDPGKIEEAQKSIKAILMGIAAIFVAIVGIVLVFVIFDADVNSPEIPQVCVSANGSVGCKRFYDKSSGGKDKIVEFCEYVYQYATAKSASMPGAVTNGTTITAALINSAYGIEDPGNPGYISKDATDPRQVTTPFLCIEPKDGGAIYNPKVDY